MIKFILTFILLIGLTSCSNEEELKNSDIINTPTKTHLITIDMFNDLTESNSINTDTNEEHEDIALEIDSVKLDSKQNIVVAFSQDLHENNDYSSLVEIEGFNNLMFDIFENTLTIIPSRKSYKKHIMTIHKVIQSADENTLTSNYITSIVFNQREPSVKFISKGVILPDSKYLEVPIKATNVQSINLRAFKVYEDNIGQFLQSNTLEEQNDLKNVGRLLWDKKIVLKNAKANSKDTYTLDVSKLLANENGSLIQLSIYIDRSDSLYECKDNSDAVPVLEREFSPDLNSGDYSQSSGWDFKKKRFKYADKKNPCKDAYYHTSSNAIDIKNLIKSNIGLIAKFDANSDQLYVAATNLKTAEVYKNINVEVYNFQNQIIGKSTLESGNLAKIKVSGIPHYLKAKRRKDIGYLKLSNGSSLPTSQFDVSGVHIKHDINGFIYGERDVWRPGDKIFLTFVLSDPKNKLPKNYPIKLDLFNPSGQLVTSKINNLPAGKMYSFELKTASNSKTGKWKAIAYVGNQKFSKNLNIETIVPNRLKIDFDMNKKILLKGDKSLKGKIAAQWLHGAKAPSLKTDLEVHTKAIKTSLGKYNDFIFDDVTREFKGDKQEVFAGKLNLEGIIDFPISIDLNNNPSGMLKASFTTKVYEEGGEFSTNLQSFIYHPYQEYVGIKLPKGDETRGMVLTDQEHSIDIAMLNAFGEPLANKEVDLTFHKISWRWWWDKTEESLAKYASSSSYDLLSSGLVTTDMTGKAKWKIRVNYPDWGRYLVRACSKDSNHCSSKVVYIDWPGWAGRAVEENTNSVARLTLTSDKDSYQVGETAIISLPKSKNSRLLVSLENGSSILKQFWTTGDKSQIEIPITKDMVPNTYITVSLLQPHKDRENDRPIRLMGILNLMVGDTNTHLNPQIVMDDEVKPASSFELTVSEKEGRKMNYSLAVVDEGLLGITNYQTPSLHKYFYKRKGLQVKTWDLYDNVVGAYSGDLEKMLDVGGSDSIKEEERNKKSRFKPVVRYLGTFTLEKNSNRVHKVTLPNYIGSVRVMVVAENEKRYGKVDKSVLVKSPISTLVTLPRKLNVNETISLPVDVFVMNEGIKNVDVTLEADTDFFEIIKNKETLHFSEEGEQIAQLELKSKNKIGKGKVTVIAKSGTETSKKTVYIDIQPSNLPTYTSLQKKLKPEEEIKFEYKPHGVHGTNKTIIEVSSIPAMNLENRINSLITYPHGCIEQTTSSVFPQLYLSSLMKLNKEQTKEIQENIEAAIHRLQSFQLINGAFSYWPSQSNAHEWGTNYVMHFLLEARSKGYHIPSEMLNKLISFQKKEAKKLITSALHDTKNQAYRLYNLSLANNADMSAMYRLKEDKSISNVSRWLLAAAYSQIGQKEIVKYLTKSRNIEEVQDTSNDKTFASDLREKAIMLLASQTVKSDLFADSLANEISKELSSDKWLSTQATAYSLLAMSKFALNTKNNSIVYSVDDNSSKLIKLEKAIHTVNINETNTSSNLYFKNTGNSILNILIANKGVAKEGSEVSTSNMLRLSVKYEDNDGDVVDITKLAQGRNFIAKIYVQNISDKDFENIVLNYKVASGWQIHNERLAGDSKVSNFDHQDIRDDRVYTYFTIKNDETKEFIFHLNASFIGSYYLPAISVESMYDNKVSSVKKGMKVEVNK